MSTNISRGKLLPEARNATFVATQAAMLAITKSDPAATKRCLEIALSELKIWRTPPERASDA